MICQTDLGLRCPHLQYDDLYKGGSRIVYKGVQNVLLHVHGKVNVQNSLVQPRFARKIDIFLFLEKKRKRKKKKTRFGYSLEAPR